MKPFDLKKALAGEPVVTRDGRKVDFIFHDPGAPDKKMRVYARYGGDCNMYREDGIYNENREMPWDLFMAPSKQERWMIVNDDGFTSRAFKTKEEAEKLLPKFTGSRVCRVEWEE